MLGRPGVQHSERRSMTVCQELSDVEEEKEMITKKAKNGREQQKEEGSAPTLRARHVQQQSMAALALRRRRVLLPEVATGEVGDGEFSTTLAAALVPASSLQFELLPSILEKKDCCMVRRHSPMPPSLRWLAGWAAIWLYSWLAGRSDDGRDGRKAIRQKEEKEEDDEEEDGWMVDGREEVAKGSARGRSSVVVYFVLFVCASVVCYSSGENSMVGRDLRRR